MKFFDLFDRFYVVDEGREEYNALRLKFDQLGNEAADKFVDMYRKENRCVEDVLSKGYEQFRKCIQPALQACVEELFNRGVRTMDTTQFWKKYVKCDYFSELLSTLNEAYEEIIAEQQEQIDYRRERKDSRGRFVGGGFGVGGALSGMAEAGALNAASGALHSLANGIGNSFTRAEAEKKKKELFQSQKMLEGFRYRVYLSTFDLHYALTKAIYDTTDYAIEGRVFPSDEEKAKAVLKNAMTFASDEEGKKDALIESHELNPYDKEWYYYVIRTFGDSGGCVQDMADYFGVNAKGAILNYKRKLIAEKEKGLTYKNEAEANEVAEKLDDIMCYYGCFDSKLAKEIEDYLEKCEIEACTVDGVELDSREEAEEAQKELEKIQIILDETNLWDIVDLAIAQVRLRPFKTAVGEKYRNKISKLYKIVDHYERMVDGEEVDSRDKAAEKKEIAAASIKKPCFRSVAERREKIKQACAVAVPNPANTVFAITSKLVKGLGLTAYQETFFAYDATVFSSGKNGFAITCEGFVCRNMSENIAHLVTFEEVANAKNIYWRNADKTELCADDKTLLYVPGLNPVARDGLKNLVDKIAEIARTPIIAYAAENAPAPAASQVEQKESAFCIRCGAKQAVDSRFCCQCGAPIEPCLQ